MLLYEVHRFLAAASIFEQTSYRARVKRTATPSDFRGAFYGGGLVFTRTWCLAPGMQPRELGVWHPECSHTNLVPGTQNEPPLKATPGTLA